MMVSPSKKFRVMTNLILVILTAASLAPMLLIIVASITDEKALIAYGYSFFPRKLSLEAFNYIFKASNTVFRAYGITFFVTAVGTTLNIAITTLLAYPLSRKGLKGKNVIAFLIFFCMLFNGGLVPSYIMWTQMFHIRDTIWALIFPNLLLSSFNVIMVRNFFNVNIPEAIVEAAMIDGASELQIFRNVVMPLSKPIIATIGLMCGLGYWNDWMNGLYYLVKKSEFYNIQNVLNTMLNNANYLKTQSEAQGIHIEPGSIPSIGIRMAIAVIALVPILMVYPFVQKAFIRGIVVGGVKG